MSPFDRVFAYNELSGATPYFQAIVEYLRLLGTMDVCVCLINLFPIQLQEGFGG